MAPKQFRLEKTQKIAVEATQEEWEAVFTLCAEGGQSLNERRINGDRVVTMALRVIARAQRGEAAELRLLEDRRDAAALTFN